MLKNLIERSAKILRKDKYNDNVLPRLEEIKAWCAAGFDDGRIAQKLGICCRTFKKYKEEHIELAPVGRRCQFTRFFKQRIGRISLRREDDDHVVPILIAVLCDMCHAQQVLHVPHRAAAEFLHDQAHLNHFQQKNGLAGRLCGSRQSIV